LEALFGTLAFLSSPEKKEHRMNRATRITVFVVALAILIGMTGLPGVRPLAELQGVVKAQDENILTFDIACDCRTGTPSFFEGKRGDGFIVSGKIFPAGTLPSGTATNDPALPVGGVLPIGDWTCRGQVAGPFPTALAPAYAHTPPIFNTQYFMLNDGRALTVEGFAIPTGERLSLTGGIGAFSGAAGSVEEGPIGTNSTGCPNFKAKFAIRAGSMH
jgi:hypothetical protein